MFDDLRNSANDQSFPEEPDADIEPLLRNPATKERNPFGLKGLNTFGLTAFQRFILAALLFVLVVILGFMFLLVTSASLSI